MRGGGDSNSGSKTGHENKNKKNKELREASENNNKKNKELRRAASEDNENLFKYYIENYINKQNSTEVLKINIGFNLYSDYYIKDEWGGFTDDECYRIFSTRIAKVISDLLIKPECYVKKLIIGNSYITNEGAGQIAKALENNKSVELLNISINNLKYEENSSINRLFKTKNKGEIPWMFDILPWEETLKRLLETNTTLISLNISETNSNLKLLLENTTMINLKKLDISKNICDSIDLEKFLENNKSITSLIMRNMKNFKSYEKKLLQSLCNGLRKNNTLTNLDILNNNINKESGDILLNIFTDTTEYGNNTVANKTLVEFNIPGINIDYNILTKINDALKKNNQLTEKSSTPVKKEGFFAKIFGMKK